MPKIFKVYPNPFIHLDHDGYPAGACHCDQVHHVGMTTRRFVGATLDSEQTMLLEKLSKEELQYRNARQQTRFKFTFDEPTTLPVTDYYRDRLRDGEIFAADQETWKLMEASGPFVSPRDALAKSKEAAISRWRAETGSSGRPDGIDVLDQSIAALGSPQAVSLPFQAPPTASESSEPSTGPSKGSKRL